MGLVITPCAEYQQNRHAMDAFEGTLTNRVARQVQPLSMVMHNFLNYTVDEI
jgi:hypothetical protein